MPIGKEGDLFKTLVCILLFLGSGLYGLWRGLDMKTPSTAGVQSAELAQTFGQSLVQKSKASS